MATKKKTFIVLLKLVMLKMRLWRDSLITNQSGHVNHSLIQIIYIIHIQMIYVLCIYRIIQIHPSMDLS